MTTDHVDNAFTVYTALSTGVGPLLWGATIIVGLRIFRDPIAKFLERAIKLTGPAGLGLEAQQKAESVVIPISESISAEAAVAVVEGTGTTPARVILIPGSISTEYVRLNEMTKMGNPAVWMTGPDIATNLAAFWATAWQMEKTYRLIYGTQIEIVMRANSITVVDEESTRVLHRMSADAGNKQTYEEWWAFPVGQGLLLKAPEGFSITVMGKVFLAYLIREGYSNSKGW